MVQAQAWTRPVPGLPTTRSGWHRALLAACPLAAGVPPLCVSPSLKPAAPPTPPALQPQCLARFHSFARCSVPHDRCAGCKVAQGCLHQPTFRPLRRLSEGTYMQQHVAVAPARQQLLRRMGTPAWQQGLPPSRTQPSLGVGLGAALGSPPAGLPDLPGTGAPWPSLPDPASGEPKLHFLPTRACSCRAQQPSADPGSCPCSVKSSGPSRISLRITTMHHYSCTKAPACRSCSQGVVQVRPLSCSASRPGAVSGTQTGCAAGSSLWPGHPSAPAHWGSAPAPVPGLQEAALRRAAPPEAQNTLPAPLVRRAISVPLHALLGTASRPATDQGAAALAGLQVHLPPQSSWRRQALLRLTGSCGWAQVPVLQPGQAQPQTAADHMQWLPHTFGHPLGAEPGLQQPYLPFPSQRGGALPGYLQTEPILPGGHSGLIVPPGAHLGFERATRSTVMWRSRAAQLLHA